MKDLKWEIDVDGLEPNYNPETNIGQLKFPIPVELKKGELLKVNFNVKFNDTVILVGSTSLQEYGIQLLNSATVFEPGEVLEAFLLNNGNDDCFFEVGESLVKFVA